MPIKNNPLERMLYFSHDALVRIEKLAIDE